MAVSSSDPLRDASAATKCANAELVASLSFDDRREFEEAARGPVAPLPDGGVITGEDGKPVWDLSRFRSSSRTRQRPRR